MHFLIPSSVPAAVWKWISPPFLAPLPVTYLCFQDPRVIADLVWDLGLFMGDSPFMQALASTCTPPWFMHYVLCLTGAGGECGLGGAGVIYGIVTISGQFVYPVAAIWTSVRASPAAHLYHLHPHLTG